MSADRRGRLYRRDIFMLQKNPETLVFLFTFYHFTISIASVILFKNIFLGRMGWNQVREDT